MLKFLAQDLDVVETALDERDAARWLRRFNVRNLGPKMSSGEQVALQEEEKEKAKIQKAKSKASSAGATR